MSANGHRCPVCDMFRDLTPDYKERRRFALLASATLIYCDPQFEGAVSDALDTAMALLCEIENREQESQL
jgi:hypothetical protein